MTQILILSPRQCWPLQSGAKLRDYYFARALGQQASVTYIHFTDPGCPPLSKSELPFCANVIGFPKPRAYSPFKIVRGLTGRSPLPVLNYTSPEMMREVYRLSNAERYDLIHLDSIHMTGYVDAIGTGRGTVPPIVYNWHNIESELMRRYSGVIHSPLRRIYSAWTAGQLERLERSILRTALGHVVCSEREQKELHTKEPAARVAVVPNGVDTAYFSELGPRPRLSRIIFVGSMSYYPNIEAAVTFTRNVWPHLRDRLPGYSLTLVGANPAPAVLALRQTTGVEVTGTVPDLRPYYREALAAIVPLRTGSGTRLKILEAMAAGVPVVSTALGAEGLAIEPGNNILLAEVDDSESWIRELTTLAHLESRRQQLTSAALELVTSCYDWAALGRSLCTTYSGWLAAAR